MIVTRMVVPQVNMVLQGSILIHLSFIYMFISFACREIIHEQENKCVNYNISLVVTNN